jgi:hypothetical protein
MVNDPKIQFFAERMIKRIVQGSKNPVFYPGARPPDILWHYTTGEKLISILKSRTLWATQPSGLNDRQELTFSRNIMQNIVKQQSLIRTDSHSAFLRDYIHEFWSDYSNLDSNIFLISFTALEDDLSQWRAYGGPTGENGYCLGFDATGLSPFGRLGQVLYSPPPAEPSSRGASQATVGEAFLTKAVSDAFDAFSLVLNQHELDCTDKTELRETFFKLFFEGYLALSYPFIKHSAFKSEEEWRIKHQLTTGEHAKLEFLQRSHMLTRHLPLGLEPGVPAISPDPSSNNNQRKFLPLPIRKIVVGPARNQLISKTNIEAMLKSYNTDPGLDQLEVEVCCSPTPLQAL